MNPAVLYTLLSVVVVSCISLIGSLTLLLKKDLSRKLLLILVSLSAGTLFGSAFLHLIPEAIEETGYTTQLSLLILLGVMAFFLLEKIIHHRHCHAHHLSTDKHNHPHPSVLVPLNLAGDALHNFLDGLVIAAAYIINTHLGLATTLAVIIHEIPQEIADFGVLLYSGLSKARALFYNFLSAAIAILGAIVGLYLNSYSLSFTSFIIPFAAGGFLYIAGSNLIPEIQKDSRLRDSALHFGALLCGIALMYALTFLEL